MIRLFSSKNKVLGKAIAAFMALTMIFSLGCSAFAEGEVTGEEQTIIAGQSQTQDDSQKTEDLTPSNPSVQEESTQNGQDDSSTPSGNGDASDDSKDDSSGVQQDYEISEELEKLQSEMMLLDDGTTTYSSDLKPFTTGVQIYDETGNLLDPSTDKVYVGGNYTFRISFAETNEVSSRVQFKNNDNGCLTYVLDGSHLSVTQYLEPQPIKNAAGVTIGNYTITQMEDGNYLIQAAFLNVDDYGNATENVYFDNSSYATFQLDVKAKVTGSSSGDDLVVDFSDKIKIDVKVDTENDLTIAKTGSWRSWAQDIAYRVTVQTTKGSLDAVGVTDVPQGDYLTFDESSIKIYNLDGTTLRTDVTASVADGKLTTTPIKLIAGDGYIIAYNVKVDMAKVTEDRGYVEASVEYHAKNTATVTGKTPDGTNITKTSDSDVRCVNQRLSKTGQVIALKNDEGKQAYYDLNGNIVYDDSDTSRPVSIIEWTVTISDLNAATVTDVYGASGLKLYKEKPLELQYTDSEYNVNMIVDYEWADDDITFSQIELQGIGGPYDAFTLKLPQNTKTAYSMTYYTLLDTTGNHINYVFTGIGQTDLISRTVSGTVGSPVVDKAVSGSDSKNLYYTIKINIPAGNAGKYIRLHDALLQTNSTRTNVMNMRADQFTDIKISVTTASGQTIDFTEYKGTGDTTNTWHQADAGWGRTFYYFGSIIFLVGLAMPHYRLLIPSASLDMNLRQCFRVITPTATNSGIACFLTPRRAQAS